MQSAKAGDKKPNSEQDRGRWFRDHGGSEVLGVWSEVCNLSVPES
jgi:hypothetical protein